MGLEFQSRSFIHLKGPDCIENPSHGCEWVVTGRTRCFLHYCQEAKSASFDAARHALENIDSLSHSFGFFSLSADYLDCPDRDRAYVLIGGQLHEVNTRDVLSREDTPPGLYEHFEWCRTCYWPALDENPFPHAPTELEQIPRLNEPVDVAGWFFIQEEQEPLRGGRSRASRIAAARTGCYDTTPHGEFPSLVELFPHPAVAAVAQSSCWNDHYLFVGDEGVPFRDVLLPVLEASARFPWGGGLLYLLEEACIPQIAIAAGRCCALAPHEPDQWHYHEAPVFGEPGYKKR